ncbi:hypothetical protein SNL152K_7408 [Streptomyces sp. NL15-2K]|nr:hypothetical protein SNL152K_7408 [Streptomyces sp. NL15-2K]
MRVGRPGPTNDPGSLLRNGLYLDRQTPGMSLRSAPRPGEVPPVRPGPGAAGLPDPASAA